MAARRLPVFVEPFLSARVDGKVTNALSGPAVARSVAIASGLGGTSAYTWLKLPLTEDPDHTAWVCETSTLRAVLLGGEVPGDQEGTYEKWRKALSLPTVRGLVVGRSLLDPADGDVGAAVDTAVGLLLKGLEMTTHTTDFHLRAGSAAAGPYASTSSPESAAWGYPRCGCWNCGPDQSQLRRPGRASGSCCR